MQLNIHLMAWKKKWGRHLGGVYLSNLLEPNWCYHRSHFSTWIYCETISPQISPPFALCALRPVPVPAFFCPVFQDTIHGPKSFKRSQWKAHENDLRPLEIFWYGKQRKEEDKILNLKAIQPCVGPKKPEAPSRKTQIRSPDAASAFCEAFADEVFVPAQENARSIPLEVCRCGDVVSAKSWHRRQNEGILLPRSVPRCGRTWKLKKINIMKAFGT